MTLEIAKQAIRSLCERIIRNIITKDEDRMYYGIALDTVIDKLKEIREWIPCSPDTMPETNDEVLVTYYINGNKKKRFIEAASWWNDGEGEGHWSSAWDEYKVSGTKTTVVAWMSFPKPYREEVP